MKTRLNSPIPWPFGGLVEAAVELNRHRVYADTGLCPCVLCAREKAASDLAEILFGWMP